MSNIDKLQEIIDWKPISQMRDAAVPGDSRPVFNKAYESPSPYGISAQLVRHRTYPNPIKHWRKQLFPRGSSGASGRRVPIPYNAPGSTAIIDAPRALCEVVAEINEGARAHFYTSSPNNNPTNVLKPNLSFYTDKPRNPQKPLFLHGPGFPGHNGHPCCSPESNVIKPTAGMNTKRINPIVVKNNSRKPYLTNPYSFNTAAYLRSKGKSFKTREAGFKAKTTDKSSRSLYPSRLAQNVYLPDGDAVRSQCCDVVIKPSNPQFFTQGAVSSSSRIERLKYNTLLSKKHNSSFTTAWAIAADNAGRYRTNGSGPYFMKNKATICDPQNYARFNKVCGAGHSQSGSL